MWNDDDDNDRAGDDPRNETSLPDDVWKWVGRIEDCDGVSWCNSGRTWEVEVTLKDGTQENAYLSERELRELAAHEPEVMGAWEGYSAAGDDYSERMDERQQMGFCNL